MLFPTDASKLADERDMLRGSNPLDPKIKVLSDRIKGRVNEYTRDRWRSYLDKCSFNQQANNLWRTIRNLTNKSPKTNNISIKFNGFTARDDKRCADKFNQQFTPHPNYKDILKKSVIRRIHKQCKTSENLFTIQQVCSAIGETKPSKAQGPDGIAPIMLKNIGTKALTYLTELLNISGKTLPIYGKLVESSSS